jgi:hypothetical protein
MKWFRWVDDIENFWKFWCVRFGLLATAFGAALAAYAAGKAIGLEVVQHVPQWLLDVLMYGSLVCSFASVISRGLVQDKLAPRRPTVPANCEGVES